MWIKSQDYSYLIDAKVLYFTINIDGDYEICTDHSMKSYVLGTYKNRIKTIQELEKIEKLISRGYSDIYFMPIDEGEDHND